MIKVEFHVDEDEMGLDGSTNYEGDMFQLTAELIQIIDDLANRVGKDEGEDGTLRELVRTALESVLGVDFAPESMKKMRDFTMALSYGGDNLPSFLRNKNNNQIN